MQGETIVQDRKIRKTVFSALMAALVCVATMVIQIPSPASNGYVNFGDCFVLISGWLLGPLYGAAAGGIGSMLTDLFLGYAHYAPGTLIIKGLMSFLAAVIHKSIPSRSGLWIGGAVAEIEMVVGYFGFTTLLLGNGSGALLSIPGNLIQGSVSLLAGVLLMRLLQKSKLDKKFFES